MKRQIKMTHRRAQALLGDYAAGELAVAKHQALTAHLQICETCRKDLAEIAQIRTRLRTFALPADTFAHDPAFNKSSMAFSPFLGHERLEEMAPAPGQMVRGSRRRSVRRPLPLLVAVVLACCLLLSTVAIFAIATYTSNSAAHPHPISRPTATPTATPVPMATPITTPVP